MLKLNRFYFDQAISIDNALTTNQLIHQIVNEINKMIDVINNIDSKANEYTDSQIAIVNGEIGELRDELSNSITALEAYAREAVERGINAFDDDSVKPRLQALYDALDEVDNRLDSKIDREVDVLDTKIDRTKNELIYLVDTVKAELIELIKKGNAIIYSGYTGLRTPLQTEIYENIYSVWSKFFGLTWDRYDLCFASATTCLETFTQDTNSNSKPIINVNNDLYHFKYTTVLYDFDIQYVDDTYAQIIIHKTQGTFGNVDACRITTTIYHDENIVKNADDNTIYVNNVPIASIDYSYMTCHLGTYVDNNFTASSFFNFSKINATDSHRVKITWNTLQYLIDLHVALTYDFINYYFYSDFNKVFGSIILDNSIQYGLNRTLLNFNSSANQPNNCNVGTQFGVNNLPFLNKTITYFSDDVKCRIFDF